MLPDNPRVLTCPRCKGQKGVLSLMSGNTFGAIYWSDTKREAPMLPAVSPVQRCPHCGYYYFTDKQPYRTSDDDEQYSSELGTLSFDECKEALDQFKNESLDAEDETTLRMLAVFAFNDKYHRYPEGAGSGESPNSGDVLYFKDNVLRLIGLFENSDETTLFRAELYREIGMFKECLEVVDRADEENERIASIKGNIKRHAEEKDSIVFRL